MSYHLNIRRGEGGGASRWQRFESPCAAEDSVAHALEELGQREFLQDETGEVAERIAWDCACLEKKCGACAMVISGRPALACAVSLGAAANPAGEITLEPLRKFPRIRDLHVDRDACFTALQEMELWLEEEADLTNRARRELHYRAAGCLMCGLCLEVCPHFSAGRSFVGAMGVAAAFRVYDQSTEGSHRASVGQAYRRRFFSGCTKSLACQDICPAKVPVEKLLVKINAAAVWHRKQQWEKEN